MKRLILGVIITLWAAVASAQNPVSISQVGTTPVTTTVPVSGTVTATTAIADGADVTQGAKADAKSTATDTTAITLMQVFKEISFMEQNPASRAVTNAGTFAVQAAQSGTWTVQPGNTANTTAWKVDGSAVTQPVSAASGTIASGAVASGAVASGAYASGSVSDGAVVTLGAKADAKSTATDTTSITLMQVMKEISFMAQNPASVAVTNAGTFAVQAAQSGTWTVQPGNTANTTAWKVDGSAVTQPVSGTVSITANSAVNVAQVNGVTTLTGVGAAGTGAQRMVDVASGTIGSAPPTQASYAGGVTSGATGGLLLGATYCDSQGYLDMTTATTTEIAPLVASRTIRICSIVAMANGTTVMTFKRGTGTNCGTGTASISPAWDLTAQAGFSLGNGAGVVLGDAGAGTAGGATTSGNAVCITSSAAVNLHVLIRYAVY